MARKSRATFKTETDNSFTQGSDKWTGVEVETALTNIADSSDWIDEVYTMTNSNFDGNNGRFQQRTVTGNEVLTLSNCVSGQFYALRKIGSFTLTLPTGNRFTNDIRVVPAGEYYITFTYTGSLYIFSFIPLNPL